MKFPLDKHDLRIVIGQLVATFLLSLFAFSTMLNDKDDFWNYIIPANSILLIGTFTYMGFQVHLQNLKENEY